LRMKKQTLFLAALCLLITSVACNKNNENSQKTQSGKSNDKEVIIRAKITDLRNSVNFRKNPKSLFSWGTFVGYAAADLGGAKTGWDILKFAEPGYGGAGALLGGVCGSTLHYIDRNYKISVSTTGSNGTNTYSNTYEKVGYLHNEFMSSTMNSARNPASRTEYINFNYKNISTNIATEFNLDPDVIAQTFSSNTEYQIAKYASEAATKEDINSLAEMGSGSVAVKDLVRKIIKT
ncbi:MAG: hypothetical protein JSS78_08865, partial [Bacteroidetes bacterium]|nr:hypothetical protein [Bacteroidota bacterium]